MQKAAVSTAGAVHASPASRGRVLSAKAMSMLQRQGALVALVIVCIFGASRYYAFGTPENLLTCSPEQQLGLVASE